MLGLWLVMIFFCPWISPTIATIIPSNCPRTCGNIDVPYPFGIKHTNPNCSINNFFTLRCNSSHNPPRLYLGNLHVRNISLEEGTISLSVRKTYDCYNKTGLAENSNSWGVGFGDGPFRLSETRNKLTAIGCDTVALMTDAEETFTSGCVSFCKDNITPEGSCLGIGCCQTAIPKSLKTLSITISSWANHSKVLPFNPCGFAFLADKRSFDISDFRLSDQPYSNVTKEYSTSDVVVEWVVREETCEEAQSSSNLNGYACGDNTKCTYSENGRGYRCLCKEGFTGNPYLPQGCQDIDECMEPQKHPCEGTCQNTFGSYKCHCLLGMHGDGKIACQGIALVPVIVGVSGLLALLFETWWLYKIVIKRRKIKLKKHFFKRNGGLLLQQQSNSSDGSVQKTKVFTSKELEKATDRFNENRILGQGGQGTVYKGMLPDGRIVAVKKSKLVDEEKLQEFINEVVVLSEINHRNVVKLLGCCLETDVPLLVYEFIPNGSLFQYLHDQNEEVQFSWEMRLRIASEAAGAIAYLHSAASIPIYHRDIKSSNILLDEKYRAKVSDFGTSRFIAIDQTHLTIDVQGTAGYLDPEYFRSSQFTDKSDVYSFGVVLVELLSGKKAIFSGSSQEMVSLVAHFNLLMEQNRLFDIIDTRIMGHCHEQEITALANLAKKCLNLDVRKRPGMKQVGVTLEEIRSSPSELNVQENTQETNKNILAQAKTMWDSASTSVTCDFNNGKVRSLEVEPLISNKTW